MRRMTDIAALGYGRVFPKVRPPFLGMTVEAGLVNRLPHQLLVSVGSMRTMALTAAHLALEEGMRKCLQRFTADRLVAVEAHLRFGGRLQHGIPGRMADMAICTRDCVSVVCVTVPTETYLIRVTPHAHFILFRDGCFFGRTEVQNLLTLLTAPDARGMGAARPMAGFTLQLVLAERTAFIAGHPVFGFEDREDLLTFVASDAGIGAFLTVTDNRLIRVLRAAGAGREEQQRGCEYKITPVRQTHAAGLPRLSRSPQSLCCRRLVKLECLDLVNHLDVCRTTGPVANFTGFHPG